MHRRDYIALARVIKETKKGLQHQGACCKMTLEGVTRRLVVVLKEDNANFNAEKFLKACDMEVECGG